MTSGAAYFIWESHRGREIKPWPGPYFTHYAEVIGTNFIHSREELLKLPLCKSRLKRIQSAKEGTQFKMWQQSSCTDIYLRRLTTLEWINYTCMLDYKIRLENVRERNRALIPADFLEEERKLAKDYLKLRNKWGFSPHD